MDTRYLVPAGTYNKVNNFDGIRILLAFLVVFYHSKFLYGYKSNLFIFFLSEFAVSSFFVISGLLVMWSFDSNSKLIAYALKRFFRIYPLYFSIIIIQLCLLLILTSQPFNFELLVNSAKYFIANIVFLNFLYPAIPGVLQNLKENVINGSLWTIKIEVLFYLLLPCIYYLFKRFGSKTLFYLYLLSVIFFIITKLPVLSGFANQLPTQLRFFTVGMVLYFYGYKFKSTRLIWLTLAVFFALNYFYGSNIIYKAFIYPVFLGLIVYAVGFCKFTLNIKYDISYCAYLVHYPIIQLLLFFNYAAGNFYLFIATVLLIVTFTSFLSCIFLERKFIKFGHNLASL